MSSIASGRRLAARRWSPWGRPARRRPPSLPRAAIPMTALPYTRALLYAVALELDERTEDAKDRVAAAAGGAHPAAATAPTPPPAARPAGGRPRRQRRSGRSGRARRPSEKSAGEATVETLSLRR